MTIFLASVVIFFLAMMGLGVGVLVGRPPLRGTCGGNAVVHQCPVCNKDAAP